MLVSLFPQAHGRYASLPLLGAVWDGFCDWLREKGYPTGAIRRRIQAGRLVASTLRQRGVESFEQLTASELRSLMPSPTRWTEQIAGSLVKSLAQYLGDRGRLAPNPGTPTSERVGMYCRYLELTRGLAPRTVTRHGVGITEFLRFLDYDTRPKRLQDLKTADIEAFLCRAGRRLGRVSMQKVTGMLRSFLRFLAAEGEVLPGLDAQVDSPRCFRGERLPRALPWDSVRSLLRSVDRSIIKGRRDYAMLVLIATYGLRVGEVASLTLDDISWRSAQIRVPRPKVGIPLLLPLTDAVGEALLDYLRVRRACSTERRVFLRVRIPPGPIKSTAVCDVFDFWAARAGIRLSKGAHGAHCLRHSLAVHLLRKGTSIKIIGDLLGHRSTESTCVYLRLQVDDLRDVALNLPGAVTSEAQR
ncbi:MAG: tyrosine-type recombinase/integrase [Acidobacteria bacterium]|nr:tyrosine-type recombinase/integrase [Acidobacteriota bacterium]